MTAPERSILEIMQAAGQEPPRVQFPPAVAEDGSDDDGAATGRAGRYEVVGEIARGGVGVVLKGRDVDLGRDVAMKVLREEHHAKPGGPAALRRGGADRRAAPAPGDRARLRARGSQADGRPFFAMKLVKGQTLAGAARGAARPGRGPARASSAIFEQVCQTMAYAHARGVDPPRPEAGERHGRRVRRGAGRRLGLREGARPRRRRRRAARGAARAAERQRRSRRCARGRRAPSPIAGSVMGTPAYMPPEQARGDVERPRRAERRLRARRDPLRDPDRASRPTSGDREECSSQAAGARLDDAHERLDACGADAALVALAEAVCSPLRRTARATHRSSRSRARLSGFRGGKGAAGAYRIGSKRAPRRRRREAEAGRQRRGQAPEPTGRGRRPGAAGGFHRRRVGRPGGCARTGDTDGERRDGGPAGRGAAAR